MKNLYKYVFMGILAIGLGSCDDDEENVTVTVQDTVETGAVLRTLNDPSENPPIVLGTDSSFLIQVEEQDNQGGALLESVDVFVKFNDLSILSENSITGLGTDETFPPGNLFDDDVLLRNIPASGFQPGPFGLPRTDIMITEEDLAAVLPTSLFNTGDTVLVRLALRLTDGRVFSSNNAGSIITAGFFNSPFQYTINIDSGIDINYLAENNNTFVVLEGFDNTYFVEAEITDQIGGDNVQSLNVYTRFVDNFDDDEDDNTTVETLFATFGAADFTESPDGFPSVNVTITPTELVGDLTSDQLNIGDEFFVRYEVITNDGRTVTNEIIETNFYDVVDVTDCPFPPLDEVMSFTGEYLMEQVVTGLFGYETFSDSPNGPTTTTLFSETTDASQVSPGEPLNVNQRSFDADYILSLGFANTQTYVMEFNICEVTISEDLGPISGSTGLTCNGGSITLGPADGGSYNAMDDSEFVMRFQDDIIDDCGGGEIFPQVRFTKQ